MSAQAQPIETAFQPKPRKEGGEEFWSDFGFVRSVVQDGPSRDDIANDLEAERSALAAMTAGDAKWPAASPKAAKGDLLMKGYANTWVEDRDFEMVGRHAFDRTLEHYLKKNPIILLQHNHAQVLGQMHDAETDNTGLACTGHVRKPEARDPDWKHGAYNDIAAGIYRTYSIGGFFWRELVDGQVLITDIDLFEISVVAVPSNPDSIFEAAAKAIKGNPAAAASDMGKLLGQMRQLQGMEPRTDPALLPLGEKATVQKYADLAAQYAKATGRQAPAHGTWKGIVDAAAAEVLPAGAIAKAAEDMVRALYEQPQTTSKAGRVLSKANESKLRAAAESIQSAADRLQAVLDQVVNDEPNA